MRHRRLRHVLTAGSALAFILVVVVGCAQQMADERDRLWQQNREQQAVMDELKNRPPNERVIVQQAPAAQIARPATMHAREVAEVARTGAASRASVAERARSIESMVPPQSLPSPDEELWIIQKPDHPVAADATDELPGT